MKTLTDDELIGFIGQQQSQYVAPASEWADAVIARLDGDVSVSGDVMPWSKTHNLIRFRPGEVTIWGGYNGHGKSAVLNQVCAWTLNKKWLIASMEMKPESTMERMTKQVAGCKDVSHEYARRFLKWTDDRLWIYDQTDTVGADKILGVVHYVAQELKIDHVIIDSLMKCGIQGSKDQISAGQVAFVDRLCWAAKAHNVHIHLVHHMRKGEGNKSEYQRPGKHDFRGAGEIVDLVHNAIIAHRNKAKEGKLQAGEMVSDDDPDETLEIVKQRNGDWEGLIKLWFHKDSMQYLGQPGRTIDYRLMG